jgi:hypothetical protein
MPTTNAAPKTALAAAATVRARPCDRPTAARAATIDRRRNRCGPRRYASVLSAKRRALLGSRGATNPPRAITAARPKRNAEKTRPMRSISDRVRCADSIAHPESSRKVGYLSSAPVRPQGSPRPHCLHAAASLSSAPARFDEAVRRCGRGPLGTFGRDVVSRACTAGVRCPLMLRAMTSGTRAAARFVTAQRRVS